MVGEELKPFKYERQLREWPHYSWKVSKMEKFQRRRGSHSASHEGSNRSAPGRGFNLARLGRFNLARLGAHEESALYYWLKLPQD